MIRNIVIAMCLVFGLAAVYAQNPAPPVPQNLVATPMSVTPLAVRLDWQAPAGLWKFRVYRSVDDTANFQAIAMTLTPSFINHGLMPGRTYFYTVTSFVTSGNGTVIESGRSNIAMFTAGTLPPKGAISGTVTDDSTGLPIHHARISFQRLIAPNSTGQSVFTDSLGYYAALLDTGRYFVRAEKASNTPATPGYIPEWFDNAVTIAEATPVAVAESSMFVANFGLSRPVPPTFAFVEGTVTDTLGNPLRHATVVIKRTIQEMFMLAAMTGQTPGLGPESGDIEGLGHVRGMMWKGFTDSLGNYRARVISGQSYIAMASKPGYLPEFFDNKSNPVEADIIVVSGDTGGINFSLSVNPLLQNSVSGMVRDSFGTGIPSRVLLLPLRNPTPSPNTHNVRFTHTDSNGVYSLSQVRTGAYFVFAVPFSGYGAAFYKAGAYGVRHRRDADTVNVTGNVTGIDIGVVPVSSNGIAQVRGAVRSTTSAPLEGVSVFAFSGENMVGYAVTDRAGRYGLYALTTGPVRIVVDRSDYEPAEHTVTISGSNPALENVDITMSPTSPLSVGSNPAIPESYALAQNYPNPFNPTTTINYSLPFTSNVSLKVFNLIGQEVATLVNGVVQAGSHGVLWSGKDAGGRAMSSGLYFYRLKATPLSGGSEFSEMRKMVLVK